MNALNAAMAALTTERGSSLGLEVGVAWVVAFDSPVAASVLVAILL